MRMEKQPKPTKNWLNKLVDADMVFWLMPPLMLLLVFGTLAQRWVGLWPAIDQYFSTYIIWLGPIPLPGAYILLGILGLNLLLKVYPQKRLAHGQKRNHPLPSWRTNPFIRRSANGHDRARNIFGRDRRTKQRIFLQL